MLYATDRPQTVAMLEGLKCALTVAAGSWAAYAFGVAGMAWTVAVVKGTIGLLTFGAARRAAVDA